MPGPDVSVTVAVQVEAWPAITGLVHVMVVDDVRLVAVTVVEL